MHFHNKQAVFGSFAAFAKHNNTFKESTWQNITLHLRRAPVNGQPARFSIVLKVLIMKSTQCMYLIQISSNVLKYSIF